MPVCVLVAFATVVLRYAGRLQQRPLASNSYVEAQWMIFGALFLLAVPHVLRHGLNVRVDILSQRFSARQRGVISFCGHLLALVPYCLLALWVWWDYSVTSLFQQGERWATWRVWEVWEQSPDPDGLPRAPIKILVLVGFAALLLQTVAELIELGFVLTGREDSASAEQAQPDPLRVE